MQAFGELYNISMLIMKVCIEMTTSAIFFLSHYV